MFVRTRFGTFGQKAADERDHFDDFIPVMVAVAGKGTKDDDFTAKFLVGLPDQRRLGLFAGFHFASGKLPFEGEMLVRRPLRDQEESLAFDEGADHGNGGGEKGHGQRGLRNPEIRNQAAENALWKSGRVTWAKSGLGNAASLGFW